ncbi:unnamed protein product [Bemisia tabaci]|nr:unnamed protein product [Bemisia tabaci]
MLGFQPTVSRLYPPVEYPVPCDTPSLQPFVTWEHSETYAIPDYLKIFSANSGECERQLSTTKVKEALSRYEANGNPVFPLSFFLAKDSNGAFWQRSARGRPVNGAGSGFAWAVPVTSGIQVEVWKILGNVLHKPFNDISIAFERVHTHTDPDSSIHDSNEIWVSVLPGSGDFVVTLESRKEGQNTVKETNKMLYSGKIRALENPRYDSNFKELSMNNDALNTVDIDPINRCFSSKINDDQSYAGTRIFELQERQRGLSGKIVWNKDWVVNLDSILKINAFKDGYLKKPASVQNLRILPGQMHTIETGSKVDFIFDSTLRYFECVGVKVDGMEMQHPEIKSIGDEVTEYLHFVPYGNTSFSTEYEFLLACLQLIKENAMDEAANSMGTVKINVTQRKSRSGELMFGLLKYILQIQDMDQHVELVRMEPQNGCVSASNTYLSILTDPKSFLQLIHMKNFKNAYLFTTMPTDVTLQSVIDYAAASGQDYVVLYEQVFDTKRFGLLKKIDINQKFRICEVSKNWSSSVEALKCDTHLGDESVILLFNRPPSANPLVITQKVLKEISVSNVKCFLSWGEGLPPISVDRNFYSEQIKRGMVINVLVNGQWGTYRRQSIPQQQANLTQVLHLLEQSVEGVSVNFVSPALNTEIGHSILDYAGNSSSGEQVVGIAQSDEQGAKSIKLDPVFQWKLQDNVNLEDAVTIPYAYLMAHLALIDFVKHEGKKTVLIHSGHNPVGVACIAVALSAGHTVYTTAPDALGMETIKSLFGQIPSSHITNYNSGDFFVPLMLGTKGRGADIIVSDLPREEMIASWHSVAQYGCFVNLNEEMPAEYAQLPMSQFLKSVSYFSYSMSDILSLPNYRKKQLHRLVDEFLKSKQAVAIPHKTASIDEMRYRPGLMKTTQKEGAKIVLTLPTTHLCQNDRVKIDHGCKLTQYDPEQVYVILSSNLKRSASLIEWLLDRNVNKIVLATTESIGSSHAARKINEHVSKQNASVLMTSASKARSPSGAEELLAQATVLGEVTAIFSVAFDMNTEIVKNIQNAARKLNKSCSIINIWDESSAISFDDSISIVCDSHLDYTQALNHSSLLSAGSIVCVTKKRTETIQPRKKDDSEIPADKITDYLPSSIEELDMIGQCLSAKDTVSSSEECAKFFPVPSRAISEISRTDTRPVFLIPAFCETQLRPLISRLMYPCFVAHVHHKAPSINQVVLNLLRSAFQIQKLGPFTIVAETWSGGIGILLSRLLTDSGHEASLFLLQGIPSGLCSMLPSHDLNEFLVTTLIGINAETNKHRLNKFDESELLENAFNLLTPDNKKFYAVRAFKAVKKSLEFLREFAGSTVRLRSKIYLIENGNCNQLTSKEVEQMSEKAIEVIKLKSKNYRELITDPTIATIISREAPYSWNI